MLRQIVGRPTNLLLPPETFWDVASSSLQGVWTTLRNQSSRDAFNDAVKKNIIKDAVLAQATYGSILTMALFQNLQNPLLMKYKFDAEDFVDAVGPALETFHGLLMQLGNEMPSMLNANTASVDNDNSHNHSPPILTDPEINTQSQLDTDDTYSILGPNLWREEAVKNLVSPAGRLLKMSTNDAFDAFFYSAKLVLLAAPGQHDITVTGCEVGAVALLNARALVLDKEDVAEKVMEHPEFKASEITNSTSTTERVAAQMDVLYEITHTYKQSVKGKNSATAEIYDNIAENNNSRAESESIQNTSDSAVGEVSPDNHSNAVSSSADENAKQYETILTTTLGVAVFEGWLHGGPDGQGLRWKVALLRDASEFPHHPSIVKVS